MNATNFASRFTILLAVPFLFSIGCTASSDSPDVVLEQANILRDRGQFNEAVEAYDKALKFFPDRADVYFDRGGCYENLQLPKKALTDYSKCLELDPEHSKAINEKGVVLAKMKDFQKAADQFSLLIEKYPDNVLAWRNRGLCLHDLGNYEGALRDYEQAIKLDNENAQTWFQKGNVRLQQGLYADAILDYDKAIELDPTFSKAWMNRGVSRYNQGNKQEAMAELMHARELNNDIIIPDIDWAESAPVADVVITATPMLAESFVGWPACEAFAKAYLVQQGFSEIESRRTFVDQQCGVLKATKAGLAFDIYIGQQSSDKSNVVSLPAIETPAEGSQVGLLVLTLSTPNGDNDGELTVADFKDNWEYSTAKSKPVVVEVSL